jgi:hypothetical protein
MGSVKKKRNVTWQQSWSIKQENRHLIGVIIGHFGSQFQPNPA